jgi:hypothetical protein
MLLTLRFNAVLGWLKALFHSSPPDLGRIVVNDERVSYARPDGQIDTVRWADLRLAGVETNDGGPFVEDVYFFLEGPEYGFFIPQGADGSDELTSRLAALPGFDGDSFTEAMCSAANARFVCWRKGSD